MSERKQQYKYVDIAVSNLPNRTHNRVKVSYDAGGYNYFTGEHKRRGYYLSILPIEQDDGWLRYTAFSGKGTLVREADRYSAKELNSLAETLLPHAAEFSALFGEDDGAQIITRLKGLTEHG